MLTHPRGRRHSSDGGRVGLEGRSDDHAGAAGLVILDAEVRGRGGSRRLDVRVRGGTVTEAAACLRPERGEPVVPAGGGALVPGLRDHHLHLRALCAAHHSVWCGPPSVRTRDDLAASLRQAAAGTPPPAWIRGIGYHERVAGPLDSRVLDAIVADRPVRIQHRSGRLWVLNTAGLRRLGVGQDDDRLPGTGQTPGPEAGRDGRLVGADRWLRERLGPDSTPGPAEAAAGLARVGRDLASLGVVGLTDATATNGPLDAVALPEALDQEVLVMGDERLSGGPRKVVLEDDDLPSLEALEAIIHRAHGEARVVAVHCVGRAALWLTLAAFAAAGTIAGDRLEHGSVIPPEALTPLRELGVTVVTQPNFISERGDEYLDDVDPADQPWLYRVAGLLRAGVRVAAGTDAPFGGADPWRAMAAAVTRRTGGGAVLGARERVSPERALALFTGPLHDPARPLRIAPGAPADLCLLAVPWQEAREQLSGDLVAATVRAGRLVYRRAGR